MPRDPRTESTRSEPVRAEPARAGAMHRSFDLVVIGGGSGGLAGAFRAAEHGARVALIEPGALGGTCVNVGCVPKKAMWLAAELGRRLCMAGDLGFVPAHPAPGADGAAPGPLPAARLDWPTFLVHRQRYIAAIHGIYAQRLDAAGIAVIPGRGRLLDAHTVACDDGETLHAPRVLVATGGRPFRPDIPGADLGGVSDDFFRWTAAPERVAIVGGGYIGVELAGLLQALGSRVEMFVRGPRLLPEFDADVVEQLAEDYRQAGVRIHVRTDVAALEAAAAEGVVVRTADGARSERFDALLFATGRRSNTAGLGLEAAGVALDARGRVVVDDGNATSAESVFAVGDVATEPALTPVAIAAARRLMDRLYAGRDRRLARSDIPTVVFSHPPLGQVGLTEAEARARHGDDVHVLHTRFRPMLRSLADDHQRSLFKLVCVGAERRVVGLHLLGEAADEILQGFAVALRLGATLQDFHDTVAIHPTSAEEVVLMR